MSKIEVNAIEPQSGTSLTLGASGDTITIPSGATFSPNLTAPIINEINDANGNEEIIFTTTASAVNELTITNAATGNSPVISATGGDTNIGIGISAKGTGTVDLSKTRIGAADTSARLNIQAVDIDGIFIRHGDTNSGIKISSQNNTMTAVTFTTNYGTVGTITCGPTTAYNTSSDYRLKENVTYDFDAITRLKQLKPARFNFIVEPNKTIDGFLAHEVQSVIPEAITGTKDEIDSEGNPVYQGIDQSKLTPILTKALQEAIAKIEQLEARITTLENK
jgi:hypothetical protein